jgi:Flp pilus assembly protein TadG
MISNRRAREKRRRGGAAVETAGILILLFSFIFGVFEIGRLFFTWNLVNAAARQGCRYAIVNNTSASLSTDVTSIVTTAMVGQQKNFTNFTVTVTGYHNGVLTAVTSLVPGDLVAVGVSGTFQFLNIIPIKRMPTNFTMASTAVMACEGGM